MTFLTAHQLRRPRRSRSRCTAIERAPRTAWHGCWAPAFWSRSIVGIALYLYAVKANPADGPKGPETAKEMLEALLPWVVTPMATILGFAFGQSSAAAAGSD